MKNIQVDKNRLTLISGPCVLESVKHATFMAKEIKSRCDDLDIQHIFKASWDKANRTALDHYRGYPLDEAVDMFREIKSEVDVPASSQTIPCFNILAFKLF